MVITGHRLSIPTAKQRIFIGRDAERDRPVEAVHESAGARVLVFGVPGVGKDVLAAEAVD